MNPTPAGFWKFILVPGATKRLRLLRVRPELHAYKDEVHRQGYWVCLTLGDRVYFKPDHYTWRLMFRLELRADTRLKRPVAVPMIYYGKRYGPHPDQWRPLARLSQAVLDNAGIDPTWIPKQIKIPTQGGPDGN